MNWRVFFITFGTIFLAEMGDKPQLAAFSMTADTKAPVSVFLGASLGLVLATLLGVALGSFASHREILAPAVRAVDTRFKDQPLVRAQLRSVLASLYSTLGKFDAAQPLAEQVLETRRHELGEKHPDTLVALLALGVIHVEQAKHAEAEACFRQALALGRAALGDDHEISRKAANDLVIILSYRGKDSEAEPYARDVFERNRRILGPDDPTTLESMNSLAITHGALGKKEDEAAMLKTVMETQRRSRGNDDPETLISIANYACLSEGTFLNLPHCCQQVLG